MSGWYAMKRGWLEHEMFMPEGKWSRAEAWVWMVESAAFKPSVIDIGGKPYTVPRGALCFSERFLADKFKWSRKAVQTFLKQLEAHGVIKKCVAKTGTGTKSKRVQITLCNYEKYQSAGTKTEPKGNQKGTKEEQGNKETNIPVGEAEASDPVSLNLLAKFLFNEGSRYLVSKGVDAKHARSIIGRWRRDAQDDTTLISAIQAAQTSGTEDPVPYITAALKPKATVRSASDIAEQLRKEGRL